MERISYTRVINRKAKRLSFSVTANDGLRVVLPRKLSEQYVQRILQQHRAWINKQLAQFDFNQSKFRRYRFQHGGTTVYNGIPHKLVFMMGARSVTVDNSVITIQSHATDIKMIERQYARWMIKTARKEFNAILRSYSMMSGINYSAVSIRGQKSRWGSCSRQGNISLNWKLLCAPGFVREYVIIHELMHINHLNHSKRFWSAVKKYSPQAGSAKQWLNRNGDLIQFVTTQFS